MKIALTAGVAATVLLTACAGSGDGSPVGALPSSTPVPALAPGPSPAGGSSVGAAASVSASPLAPVWVVGASPLPLRPDGFGQVLPTPVVLRDRRLPTVDLLRPPADGQFHDTIGAVTSAIRTRMGQTWSSACPVPLSGLRYVTVVFRGFDRKVHRGELVVAASAAPKMVRAFRALFAIGFPIEEMRLPTTQDILAKPTGDGNNTAAYVCRAARGQTRFSQHAYGQAIDVNPFDNPEVKRDLVLPELASAYKNRSWHRAGMFLPGGAAVRAFTSQGWGWGGIWTSSSKDYMHFSANGA
ncbi:MAG: hypothetical protein QOJ79_2707 [Actinomycetota bacterium]|jgi:hypothetical protein|nr:hypothetical protein [Actinomycetota bacterium]